MYYFFMYKWNILNLKCVNMHSKRLNIWFHHVFKRFSCVLKWLINIKVYSLNYYYTDLYKHLANTRIFSIISHGMQIQFTNLCDLTR